MSMTCAVSARGPHRLLRNRGGQIMAKHIFDKTIAALVLMIMAVPMLLIAAAILILMGRPILFRQTRPGFQAVPFTMVKFRTMRVPGPDRSSTDSDPANDGPRLTRLGRFLRATSLDELPGLWNVVRGEMSLVGPRPLLMEYLPLYSPRQARRHLVRPGVTGWAQVNGRNAITWAQKFELDIWYVEHQSFALDCRILALTVKKVLWRDGIAAAGAPTMPKFTGRGAQ